MAGPTASIILRHPIDGEITSQIRHDISLLANEIKKDDFWIDNRPFHIRFGVEYEGQLQEYIEGGFVDRFDFIPQDTVALAAMSNGPEDHRILGQLCSLIAAEQNGIIDFGTVFTPAISSKVRKQHNHLYGNTWAAFEPHFRSITDPMPGIIESISYRTVNGTDWVFHCCDAAFMQAWLSHDAFHMFK